MINSNCCTLCQAIKFDTIITTGITLPLKPYLLAWQQGSHSQIACGLCALLYNSLRYRLSNKMSNLIFGYNKFHGAVVVMATKTPSDRTRHQLKLLCGETGEAWYLDPLDGTSEVVSAFQASIMALVCETGRKTGLSLTAVHPETDTNFVPTRLIDVKPDTGKHTARLVSLHRNSAQNNSIPVKYVALSYCWGTRPFLTTNSSNLKAMRQSIPLSQLPRTVQDAVRIVRYLGFRYLWVDSLCILQGTNTEARRDWLSESARMGQVYRSAYFTISAESAPTAFDGILNERPTSSIDFCIMPNSTGTSNVVYLGPHQFSDVKIIEPLHRRGWTLQETILSCRLLKFGSKEISWRCTHTEERESRGKARIDHHGQDNNERNTVNEHNEQSSKIHKDWQTIVEDYNKRSFTENSDKLPAIAGLAQIAQQINDDTYAAGVLGSRIPWDLLWKHQRIKSRYARKEAFQAPTWSWASIEGSLRFMDVQGYSRPKNFVAKLSAPNDDMSVAFGSPAQLCIKSWVLRLSSIRCHQFASYYGGYDRFLPWTDFPDSLKTYLDDMDDIPSRHKRGEGESPKELVDSYFLLLAQNDENCAGLILLPANKVQNTYKRTGMFEGFPVEAFVPPGQYFSKYKLEWMGNHGRWRTMKII